jgi:sulfide:quinone oxidoreductase
LRAPPPGDALSVIDRKRIRLPALQVKGHIVIRSAMHIRKLTDRISVSPQILPGEMADLEAAGFRSVINNRPDGEASEQPTSAEMAQAAAAHGLAYRNLPVVPGRYEPALVDAMAQALQEMPAPVLAFCRTGTRSTTLWALQAARHAEVESLLATAAQAGYDLAALAPRLRAQRAG